MTESKLEIESLTLAINVGVATKLGAEHSERLVQLSNQIMDLTHEYASEYAAGILMSRKSQQLLLLHSVKLKNKLKEK
jgi:hypothetical protein